MTNAEEVTGARDEHYDLVSVLYDTMQEASSLQTYRRCSVRRRQRPRRLL